MFHYLQWATTLHHHIQELCSTLLIQDILHTVVHLLQMLLTILLILDHTLVQITQLMRAAHNLEMLVPLSVLNHMSSNSSMDGSKFVLVVKDLIQKDPIMNCSPPPSDFCIQHTEPLKFINPYTGIESSKIGNAYYHINIVCIHRKHPHFSPKLVSCPEVINIMQPSHFKLLYDALGYVSALSISFKTSCGHCEL